MSFFPCKLETDGEKYPGRRVGQKLEKYPGEKYPGIKTLTNI